MIVRDQRCADTIDHLLNDLEILLRAEKATQNATPGTKGELPAATWISTSDGTLTRRLRSKLLSLREALFRHASFLEFLPAPGTVDRARAVPGGTNMDGSAADDGEESLDPEVIKPRLRILDAKAGVQGRPLHAPSPEQIREYNSLPRKQAADINRRDISHALLAT